jgi:hypothetical protein
MRTGPAVAFERSGRWRWARSGVRAGQVRGREKARWQAKQPRTGARMRATRSVREAAALMRLEARILTRRKQLP